MPQYKVRNKRQKDGSYLLIYGKGKRKLAGVMVQAEDGWRVSGGDSPDLGPFDRMKDCKERWGDWAAGEYEGSQTPATPPPPPPAPKPKAPVSRPSLPPPPPPVKARPAGGPPPPPTYRPSVPPVSLDRQCAADPYDPRFRYPSDHEEVEKRRYLTPVGVLVEIEAWAERHKETISKTVDRAGQRNPFTYLMESVSACIARECPERKKGKSDVEAQEAVPAAGPPKLTRAAAEAAARPLGPVNTTDLDPDDIPF